MGYFEKHFNIISEVANSKGEVKVLCPFHSDTNPSATVNLDKRLFHCWVCGNEASGSEAQFMAKVEGISEGEAYKKILAMSSKDRENWTLNAKAELWINQDILNACEVLGITREVLDDLDIGVVEYFGKPFLGVPVFYKNSLKDIRGYNVLKHHNLAKLYGVSEADMGWVLPHDQWLNSKDDTTYIMEGEKDMLLARSLGLNAVCITGGAGASVHKSVIDDFRDKKVVIIYDNDDAGYKGANKLGISLSGIARSVGIIEMSKLVIEKGEDFSDYILKYKGSVFDIMFADTVPPIRIGGEEATKTPIFQALKQSKYKKDLVAEVTVTGELSDAYMLPTVFKVTKKAGAEYIDGEMASGEERSWVFDENKMQQILPLIETDAKDKIVKDTLMRYAGVPLKEKALKTVRQGNQSVYKAQVSDKEFTGTNTTIDTYSFMRLDVGKNYEITYQLHPHPNKNQKVVALIKEAKLVGEIHEDEVERDVLMQFKYQGTIEERLNYLYESAKHHVAPHMDYNIWLMTDLVFNSILEFEYGTVMRGALDVFILGDTEVGKSETSEGLLNLYNFGHKISLLGASTVGLIGGSNKQPNDTYVNTIGAIPRQHKKLVILEEFSGSPEGFIASMTDIRSSNKVRIARASGELVADCMVRMITISNPINDRTSGKPRFLSSFPDGVTPLMELIKSAEDVRRYDGFLLIPKVKEKFNPFKFKLSGRPIPVESYRKKIKWVETRKPSDVVFDTDVQSYIWETAEKLNEEFESNVPIFGTTTHHKLARFCVAMASLVVSLNEENKVLVTKEIVDYTASWLSDIYSSKYFRLDEVRKEWLSYTSYEEHELQRLQELYARNAVLIDTLGSVSFTTQNNLRTISGLKQDDFGAVFNKLVQLKVVQLNGNSVSPTEKFRMMYHELDRTLYTVEKHIDLNKEVVVGGNYL